MILYTLTDQGTGGKYFMVRGVFNLYIYKIRKIRVTQTFVNWARIYSQVWPMKTFTYYFIYKRGRVFVRFVFYWETGTSCNIRFIIEEDLDDFLFFFVRSHLALQAVGSTGDVGFEEPSRGGPACRVLPGRLFWLERSLWQTHKSRITTAPHLQMHVWDRERDTERINITFFLLIGSRLIAQ